MPSIAQLNIRSQQLEKNIQKWNDVIARSPQGVLISRAKKNSDYEYSYYVNGATGSKKEIYIPQSNLNLAKQLAMREYAKSSLEDALREKRATDLYIKTITEEKKADRYLEKHPGAAKLILKDIRSRSEFIREWTEKEYVRNEKYKEFLKYPTVVKELLVRSKSEADIVSRMVHYGIPFRYEEQVIINGIVFHPDFTCLNINTLEVFYLEHLGALDKQGYIEEWNKRQFQLAKAGIIPWKNLLITTETRDQPLDINWVDDLIKFYLM